MSEERKYEEKTLRLIEKEQLKELNKEFPEIKDLGLLDDDHDFEAFNVSDQTNGSDPENSEELEPVRHNKRHEVITDKDSVLTKSAKLDKPSD